jgi:hypothetical protein
MIDESMLIGMLDMEVAVAVKGRSNINKDRQWTFSTLMYGSSNWRLS